jgi:hypothetical protein
MPVRSFPSAVFPAVCIVLGLVAAPLAAASWYYTGGYDAPQPLAYGGDDGCQLMWNEGLVVTQGGTLGDNCIFLSNHGSGVAYTVNITSSVVPPTAWHVCFYAGDKTRLGCGTGGTTPVGSILMSFAAQDGVKVKWNVTLG